MRGATDMRLKGSDKRRLAGGRTGRELRSLLLGNGAAWAVGR